MIHMAAKGETAEELKTLLSVSEENIKLVEKYRKSMEKLQLVNRVHYENRHPLSPNYESLLKENFKVESNIIPRRAEPLISIINKWVFQDDNETINGNIKAMFTNIINLTDRWQFEFDAHKTKRDNFKVSINKTVSVQMMYQANVFRAAYFSDLQATVVELPFSSWQISLLLFLPNKVDGLWEMEQKIVDFSEPLNTVEAILALPKLRIEFKQNLVKVLPKVYPLNLNKFVSFVNIFLF